MATVMDGIPQAPQEAPRPRGLLGGFFGPEGRDARSRLAIGLEGLTLNPNQALIGQLQQGIESRATASQKNATIEWLRSRGHDDLAAALEAGAPAQAVLAESMQRMRPADPMDALNLQIKQLELQQMQSPQPGFRRATPEESAAYGAQAGQFGPDGRFYAEEVAQPAAPERGVVVGGNVVDPITGEVIYQGEGKAPDPQSAIAKLEADRRAGLINDEQYKAGLQALAPTGTSVTVGPDGQVQFTQGVGVGGTGAPTVGQVYNPNEIQSVIGMIDKIATDPNLPNVVGQKAVILGGGNKISDMNMTQRLAYGQEGLGLIERIGQLQSNAWLSARQMLKGGGAITDYESQKAEAAVARLERPKGEGEFKQALKDLRDAITAGEAKLRASQGGPPAPAGGTASVANDAEYEALPSGTQFIGPDGKLRRKP